MDVISSFQNAVRRHPDDVALVYRHIPFTYQGLDALGNRIAASLTAYGAGGKTIGVAMQRSPEWIAVLLGIWKSGGVYVPLDMGNPIRRLESMIADSGIRLVVCNEAGLAPQGIPCYTVEELMSREPSPFCNHPAPDSLACIIYTSGTSGTPKGIPMLHRQLTALSEQCMEHLFYVRPGERMLQFAGLNFSASLVEVLTGLLHGICLVMTTEEEKHDVNQLVEVIAREQVTSALLPPALLSVMPHLPLPGLKTLVVAGECVAKDVKEYWMQGRRMVNGYGFTENTVLVASGIYADGTPPNDIGTPVPDTRVYVLDASLSPVPDGTPGELCVSGQRLAAGYWNRPDLDAGKFVRNPFATEQDRRKGEHLLLYRSGDQVVRQSNGRYLYSGRLDEQIELRGIRIEPGEIEQCLNRYPGVTDSVVVLKQHHNRPVLVAYLQTGADIDRQEVAAFAAAHLPEYMCPGHYVALRQFPLTLNRKTDKKRLPEPEWNDRDSEREPPHTPTEKSVAAIWCEVLGIPAVGRHEPFLSLGGDSLSVVLMTDLLEKRFGIPLKAGEVFEQADLASLVAFIDGKKACPSGTPSGDSPSGTENVDNLPPALRNLLNECMSSENLNEGYKLAVFLPFESDLQADLLKKAWMRLVAEQDALRLSFPEGRCVLSPVTAAPPLPCVETQAFLQDAYRLYQEPLAPGSFPLYRACLYHLPDGSYRLAVVLHHLIADGWSLNLLHRTIREYYRQETAGELVPTTTVSYRAYADWSNEQEKLPGTAEKRRFWQSYLAGYADLELSVSIDPQEPEHRQGSAASFPMDRQAGEDLHRFCRKYAVTPLAVCLTVYQLLLGKYSGQTDFVVGMAVTDRRKSAFRHLMGYLTTLLPVRTSPTGTDFIGRVRRTAGDVMALLDNSLPLDAIGECAGRTGSRMIRFAFGVEEVPSPLAVPDAWTHSSPFDLSLLIHRYGTEYSYHYQYATGCFDAAFLQRFSRSFDTALRHLTAYPEQDTAACPLLPQEEIKRITSAFRFPDLPLPRRHIVACFEDTALRSPNREAYCWNGIRVSYGELKEASDRVAAFLTHRLERQGKKAPLPVGLCLKEKRHLPAGILGILKSGCCYVPLDSHLPVQRLQFMVEDAAVVFILSDAALPISRCDCLPIEEALAYPARPEPRPCPIRPEETAYLIYTSGTTGQPKGIPITHASSLLFAESQARIFGLRPDMRVLQYAGVGFDASILELFPAWYGGASLVIPTEEERKDGGRLLQLMEREKVGCCLLPPALLTLLPYRELPDLETLVVGGESTPLETMRRWAAGRRLVNAYGPTENTVVTTCAEFVHGSPANDIGTPLPGVSCYVVDRDLNLMPDGVPGELCIGGLQLTEGYIHRDELNRRLFADNPFVLPEDAARGVNTRIYRSGDKAVRTPEGHFLYLGRMDSQVKLRGFRIEPEEIARKLEEVPAVSQALVVLRSTEKGQPYLAAYVVADKKAGIRAEMLRAYLLDHLPAYMVPSAWCIVEYLPMTLNGKVDREHLPEAAVLVHEEYEPPAGEDERTLADMAERLLETERLGVTTDLFDMGLTSLQAMVLVSEAQEKGLDLSVTDVYRGRYIRHILTRRSGRCHYWEGDPSDTEKPLMVLVCGYSASSPFYDRFVRRFKPDYRFFVFDSFLDFFSRHPDYPKEKLVDAYYETVLQELAGMEIAVVAGHCLGGELALSLAERLRSSLFPAIKVLAIDSFVLRSKDLLLPPNVSDGNGRERIRITNEVICRMPPPVFGGEVLAGIALRPSGQYLYGNDGADDAGTVRKMQEMSERNPADWKRLYPRAVLVGLDTDHWHVFDRQPLEQLYQAVRNHWNVKPQNNSTHEK